MRALDFFYSWSPKGADILLAGFAAMVFVTIASKLNELASSGSAVMVAGLQ